MVCLNLYEVWYIFQEVLSLFQGLDNYQHLLVVDLVVTLDGRKKLAKECYQILLTIYFRLLRENYFYCIVRAVSFSVEWGSRV